MIDKSEFIRDYLNKNKNNKPGETQKETKCFFAGAVTGDYSVNSAVKRRKIVLETVKEGKSDVKRSNEM